MLRVSSHLISLMIIIGVSCWPMTNGIGLDREESQNRERYGKVRSCDIKQRYDTHSAQLFSRHQCLSERRRVRKEIRELSREEWEMVADALNIMKTVSNSEGKAKYGERFRNYDDLVCQHYKASISTEQAGDLGHFVPLFFIFHRAYTLAFEESLLAINPKIGAAPYWDNRIDMVQYGLNISDSPIFSDEYFGDLRGDPEQGYALANGKFAYWTVPSEIDENTAKCGADTRNPYGYLRFPANWNDNPYVTRVGGFECGNPTMLGDPSAWEQCLAVESYAELVDCHYMPIHAMTHLAVGGSVPYFDENAEPIQGLPICISWQGFSGTVAVGVDNLYHSGWEFGCFQCPDAFSCKYGEDDPRDCALCSLTNPDHTCDILGNVITIPGDIEDQWLIGDFFDIAGGVVDPLFFFHHMNLDRLLFHWELRHYDLQPYYGFPTQGFGYGGNLDDIVGGNNNAEFRNLFYGKFEYLGDGPYTHRQIWDATRLFDGVYTYDSVLTEMGIDDEDDLEVVPHRKQQCGLSGRHRDKFKRSELYDNAEVVSNSELLANNVVLLCGIVGTVTLIFNVIAYWFTMTFCSGKYGKLYHKVSDKVFDEGSA